MLLWKLITLIKSPVVTQKTSDGALISTAAKGFRHRGNAIKPLMIDDEAAYKLEIEHRR